MVSHSVEGEIVQADDVMKVLGGFLGGNVFKVIVDHWLTGRRERQHELRTKDLERIERARASVEDISSSTTRMLLDPGREMPDVNLGGRAVAELDDRKLRRAWEGFVGHAFRAQLENRVGREEVPSAQRHRAFSELCAFRETVTSHLNRLERSR